MKTLPHAGGLLPNVSQIKGLQREVRMRTNLTRLLTPPK